MFIHPSGFCEMIGLNMFQEEERELLPQLEQLQGLLPHQNEGKQLDHFINHFYTKLKKCDLDQIFLNFS